MDKGEEGCPGPTRGPVRLARTVKARVQCVTSTCAVNRDNIQKY